MSGTADDTKGRPGPVDGASLGPVASTVKWHRNQSQRVKENDTSRVDCVDRIMAMGDTLSMETTNTVHAFEKAGLGKAPFRFVGAIQQDLCYGEAILNRAEFERTGIAITTKPGGSCDFCGQYIVNMYQIESSDGRRFKVGCDCVEKTGDAGLCRKVAEHRRKSARAKRVAKADAVRGSIAAILSSSANRKALRAAPHPRGFAGQTALDNVRWMLKNAGAAGRAKLLKTLASQMAA